MRGGWIRDPSESKTSTWTAEFAALGSAQQFHAKALGGISVKRHHLRASRFGQADDQSIVQIDAAFAEPSQGFANRACILHFKFCGIEQIGQQFANQRVVG